MKPTIEQIISGRILLLIAEGKSIVEAYDAVLGEGAYMKLAGEIYDELREGAKQ